MTMGDKKDSNNNGFNKTEEMVSIAKYLYEVRPTVKYPHRVGIGVRSPDDWGIVYTTEDMLLVEIRATEERPEPHLYLGTDCTDDQAESLSSIQDEFKLELLSRIFSELSEELNFVNAF
jgi:hypothetical protein